MGCVQVLFCLSILVGTHLIHGKELCTITDNECVTKEAQKAFNVFVPGIKGLIDPSDPLYLKQVDGVVPIPYRLSNLTLTGLQQCHITKLRINSKDLTYQYDLQCPHLLLNYHHKVKGLLDTVEIDTDGLATITFDDYIFKINGKYGRLVSEKDQQLHFYLNGFTLETEPRGNVICNSLSPLHSDKRKSDIARIYINEHSKDIEKFLKSPTMEKFMEKYLGNLDLYLRNFLFEVQYPETNTV
ncbi:unnamed protein product [Arctia plantaginis]|uniref:Uncharacterized protein n=1 Tax=Arctia plantaginis TaxID=874455 RepID=A0A8S0ZXD4_ARCPL|nr:unnamed protein product [Arctia plantaginis]CAB3246720.1 unnamed protein product [Arctia plantaginis]